MTRDHLLGYTPVAAASDRAADPDFQDCGEWFDYVEEFPLGRPTRLRHEIDEVRAVMHARNAERKKVRDFERGTHAFPDGSLPPPPVKAAPFASPGSAKVLRAGGLSDMLADSVFKRSQALADNVVRNNWLLQRLTESTEEFERASGVVFTKATGYDLLPAPEQVVTATEYVFRQASVPMVIHCGPQDMAGVHADLNRLANDLQRRDWSAITGPVGV